MQQSEVEFGVVADLEREEFMAIARDANGGDPGALAKLRAVLANNPQIAARLGDLTGMVVQSLVDEIAKNDPAAVAIITEKARQIRASLSAGSPSPVLQLSIDRAIVSWIAMNVYDLKFSDPSKLAPAEANLILRLKISAERRHEIALRNVAKIQALLEPPAKLKRRAAPAADTGEMLGVVG